MVTWDRLRQDEERKERRIKKISGWMMGIILAICFLGLVWSAIK